MLAIKNWSQIFDKPHHLAEQVSSNWMKFHEEIDRMVRYEKVHALDKEWYRAGAGAAVVLRTLVGDPEKQVANKSVAKDQYREADFLAGFLCGLAGVCKEKEYF